MPVVFSPTESTRCFSLTAREAHNKVGEPITRLSFLPCHFCCGMQGVCGVANSTEPIHISVGSAATLDKHLLSGPHRSRALAAPGPRHNDEQQL